MDSPSLVSGSGNFGARSHEVRSLGLDLGDALEDANSGETLSFGCGRL